MKKEKILGISLLVAVVIGAALTFFFLSKREGSPFADLFQKLNGSGEVVAANEPSSQKAPQVEAISDSAEEAVIDDSDIRPYFCDSLDMDSIYEIGAYEPYKKLVAGADGWIFRSGMDFREDFTLADRSLAYFQKLKKSLNRRGIELVLVFPPTRGIVHGKYLTIDGQENPLFPSAKQQAARTSYEGSIKALERAGIAIVNFGDLAALSDTMYYKRDHHWSPDGAKDAANRIAALIKTMPAYQAFTKVDYTTTSQGVLDYSGPMAALFQNICGVVLPPEQVEKFATARQSSAGRESELFADQQSTDVVLVGTSNSAVEPNVSNMDGFLREYLATDVENDSISGAGVYTPLLAYLNSPSYQSHPAKVIVWEIPGYYDLNVMNKSLFRQAIPAVFGDCAGHEIAQQQALPLTQEGRTNILSGLTSKALQGEDTYIRLQFSGAIKKEVDLHIGYANWQENYNIKRIGRYPHEDGIFYFSLTHMKRGALKDVSLVVTPEMAGMTLNAKICKIPQ